MDNPTKDNILLEDVTDADNALDELFSRPKPTEPQDKLL